MRYFTDVSGETFGYDETDPKQIAAMEQKFFLSGILKSGSTEITGSWPRAQTALSQLAIDAQAALLETDMVALRCFKAGVPFPVGWQNHTAALRNIVNGTDTTSTALPVKPTYPAGT